MDISPSPSLHVKRGEEVTLPLFHFLVQTTLRDYVRVSANLDVFGTKKNWWLLTYHSTLEPHINIRTVSLPSRACSFSLHTQFKFNERFWTDFWCRCKIRVNGPKLRTHMSACMMCIIYDRAGYEYLRTHVCKNIYAHCTQLLDYQHIYVLRSVHVHLW